jgi:NADH-quinone oxidoreductase subunit C
MTTSLEDLSVYIRESRDASILDAVIAFNELSLTTSIADYRDLITFLHDDERCQFISFIDLCGVDWPSREKRFDVVVHLLSPKHNIRIRVKAAVGEDEPVQTLTDLYMGAEWFEREAWDMYGIPFAGHSDLRRILTDYGFEGYPLRKDFPTTGLVEVRYDDSVKRVVYEPVALRQEFRNFDFLSPWEGTDYVLPGDEKKSQ